MKIYTLVIALMITANQLVAQWKPTPEQKKKFWEDTEKQEITNYLKTHPDTFDLSEVKRKSIFLKLINQYRSQKGLTSVEYTSALDSACSLHTLYMVKYDTIGHLERYLSLDGGFYPNPYNRIKKYDSLWVKAHPYYLENCAYVGTIGNDPTVRFKRITAESITEIMNSWKNSPGHNAAMLDPKVKYIGFFTKSKYQKRKNNFYIASTLLLSN